MMHPQYAAYMVMPVGGIAKTKGTSVVLVIIVCVCLAYMYEVTAFPSAWCSMDG